MVCIILNLQGGLLFNASWLDYDLWLHAHLDIFVFHHHHSWRVRCLASLCSAVFCRNVVVGSGS